MKMRTFCMLSLLLPTLSWAGVVVAPHDGNDQIAAPGQPVPIPPAVLVTDGDGLPMQDFGVQFSVAQGGGLVSGASTVTNGDGIATVGSWVLGTLPGEKLLEAVVDGGESVVFRAVAEAENAFSISLDPVEEPIVAGVPFTVELVVSNTGDYPAAGTKVSMQFDAVIVPESISWTCQGSANTVCSEEGSETLEDWADIPILSQVTYTVTAAVPTQLLDGAIALQAQLELPVGLRLPEGETGETELVLEIAPNPYPIFEDRFEGEPEKTEEPGG